ncbi:DUF637 domain-containing protein, partial [Moraxella canis]|uniref:DUF637 domain-containing protein n=1 Tax=Moraxella canis TaxID=90239 RepID=UPI001D0D97D6
GVNHLNNHPNPDRSGKFNEDFDNQALITSLKWLGATVDKGDHTHTFDQVDAITTTLQAKNISTKSNGSTLLEGTQFHYSDNATVVSGGKLYLQAAISGTSEHTTSNDNYVVWQKTEDSGSIKQTATLPSFVGNNTPTIIALDGVEIQIPTSQQEQKAGTTLQEQIDTLIQQPEYSYLNQFIDREDTLWQEIILAEESWDYKQEGLTPAGAAIVAIAVGMATGGTASGIAGTVAANVGSQTVGAMAGAAFSSLASQASVSLINNKGDVEATLKELGSKDNVKQLTLAIASAGISHKIDKGLGLKGIDITQTGFDQRLVKAIADSTSTSLLQTAVYGSDFEENLKKNLRVQFTAVATQDTFSNIVKDFDSDTLSDNIAHKIAAGLTGCLSAKAAGNDCDAAAIGAVVGEMWGDWHTDNPNTLTQDEKDKLINQAKLIAGVTAAYAGEDVNVAADMAAEAVRWNAVNKELVGTVKDFENLLNNSGRKVGLFQGNEAHLYLLSLNETSWMLEPTQTGYFNNKASRYIYTKKGGWIDMVHFLFYASEAYNYKIQIKTNPSFVFMGYTDSQIVDQSINHAVKQGYIQERIDSIKAPHSAYSYEDLPSDYFGAVFGASFFNPNSTLTFGQQISSYLNNHLIATRPETAPNYKDLPEKDVGKHSGITNKTIKPLFAK